MKAIRIQSYGGADQMKLEDIPVPACEPGGLLVRVVAAGVNPVDWKIRNGDMAKNLPKKFPLTLGQDAAGIVIEAGSEVSGFKAGDEVFFYADFMHGGTYAEYVTVDASQVAFKPRTVPFSAAAVLPTSGQAAWTALMDTAKLRRGMRVLVHGSAGALGSVAVQLAHHFGAHVTATASGAGAVSPSSPPPSPTPTRTMPAAPGTVALPAQTTFTYGKLSYRVLAAQVAYPTSDTLSLKFTIRMTSDDQYEANFWDASFRLRVNGVLQAPISNLNKVVSGNSSTDPRTARRGLSI